MEKIYISSDIRGLIFDCDGTLVDSMPLHMSAWEAAFKTHNSYYNEDFLYSLKGMKELDIIDLYNKEFKTSLDPGLMVNAKHDFFIKHINDVRPIKLIVNIAKSYFGKLPLAVVSGSVAKIVKSELEVLGILNLFEVILTADDPYRPKPDPDVFFAAASKINLSPEYCMVFEDGDAGLKAAEKAGMKTIDIRKFITNV
jgi:beta-phosphoglucomutase-like phosphatase (HAD superfamily)